MFKCKGPDGIIRLVTKKFINKAWVAAITVCTDNLYKRTSVVVQEAFNGLLGVTSQFYSSLRSLRTNTLYSIDPEDASVIEMVKKWCPEKQIRTNICSAWNSDDNFLYQLSYKRDFWPYECQLNSFDDAVVIDLSEHYNRRFMLRDTEVQPVEPKKLSFYLPLDAIGESIISNGITFPIEQELDNAIACNEQIIEVPVGDWKSITFLAETLTDNLNFFFTVVYEDEEAPSDQYFFTVTPAWSESREENENLFSCVVNQLDYFISEGRVDLSMNCHSYTYSLPKYNNPKQIVSIILPAENGILLYGMALSEKEVVKNSGVKFEKVNINTFRTTEITLSSKRYEENFHCIAYSPTNQLFYICTDDGYFSLTKTGQRTLIDFELHLFNSFAFAGETLYASKSSSGLYQINPSTGQDIGDPLQLTIEGDNDFTINSIAYFNGTLYALCSPKTIYSVNTESGVCTPVFTLPLYGDDFFSTDSFLYLMEEDDSRSHLYKIKELDSLEFVHEFTSTTQESAEVIAYNPDDSYLYHITDRTINDDDDDYIPTFEKLNLKTLEVTKIELDSEVTDIEDGGDDMYDTGNFIRTNNSEEAVIYRHNIPSENPWFGVNSQYFTKLFPGWFLLAAKDISITDFSIDGGLGADGRGTLENGQFVILDGAYTVYWKMVYGAEDPTVNHLIIVPGVSEDYGQFVTQDDTDEDEHLISGLGEIDHIYYLLLSTKSSTRLFEEDLQDIALAFIQMALGKTLAQIKSSLEKNSSFISDLITDYYEFYISDNYPIRQAKAMCYIGDGKFLVFCEDKVCHINTNGEVTLLKQYDDANIKGLAMLNGVVYGVLENGTTLAKIDPETGEFLNAIGGGEGIYFDIEIDCGKPLQGFRSLTNYDDTLYAIAKMDVPFSDELDHLRESLVTINEETGIATIIGNSDYFDSIAGIYE
jgi:glutamine cyclotransferase